MTSDLMSKPERDILAAARERIVVFDGGMGATLERFDLSSEDYGGLPGKCHEALVLHRPDVIEGVHDAMLEAGARGARDRLLPGLAPEARGVGARRAHRRDQPQGRRDRAQGRRARTASSPARSARPASCRPATTRRSATSPSPGSPRSSTSRPGALVEGGADLIIIETAQDILEVRAAIVGAREAFKRVGREVPIQVSVSLLPNGGKMLLGTDIEAVLAILEGMRVDIVGLNCSTGPEDMRDAIRYLGENSPRAGPLHPERRACRCRAPTARRSSRRRPSSSRKVLGEFVERHGVGIVGGCCGTTPEHIAAIVERVGGPRRRARAPRRARRGSRA